MKMLIDAARLWLAAGLLIGADRLLPARYGETHDALFEAGLALIDELEAERKERHR